MGSGWGLQSSLVNAKYPQALLKKSLEKFTAGTLERYLAAAKQFLDLLGLSNRTVATIDVAFLADFLHACENSLEEDREICKIGPETYPQSPLVVRPKRRCNRSSASIASQPHQSIPDPAYLRSQRSLAFASGCCGRVGKTQLQPPLPTGSPAFLRRPTAGLTWRPQIRGPTTDPP